MRTIFLADNLPEAELLRQRLAEEGLEVVVHNAHLQGALGELPLTCRPELRVLHDSDFSAARALVEKLERERRSPDGPELTCPACGELSPHGFELCWSCRKPIP